MRKVIDANDADIVKDIFKFKPWLSNSMEEIVGNTTCWNMFCIEPQQRFVVIICIKHTTIINNFDS
jgi:hypothetical protein